MIEIMLGASLIFSLLSLAFLYTNFRRLVADEAEDIGWPQRRQKLCPFRGNSSV